MWPASRQLMRIPCCSGGEGLGIGAVSVAGQSGNWSITSGIQIVFSNVVTSFPFTNLLHVKADL